MRHSAPPLKSYIVIPARLASTRLPRKLLFRRQENRFCNTLMKLP